MDWVKLFSFCVLFSIISGDNHLQPGLIQEYYNVFDNFSNLASMPHLMETPDCRRDCEIYRQALHHNEMWAAEMFDARGRLSLGILKGNMHQLGSINQCVSSSSKTSNINGKICMVKIHLKPLESSDTFMKEIWQNIYNFTMYTAKPYEKSVIPSSDSILATLCVPSSCTTRDLTTASRKVLSVFNHTKFGFEVHVGDIIEQNCAVNQESSNAEISSVHFAKIFILTMIVLVIFATMTDVFILQSEQNDHDLVAVLAKSFSLQQNCKTLTSVENNTNSLGCLNGLRCLAYLLLYMWHYTCKFILSVVDRTDYFNPLLQYSIAASVIKNAGFALDLLFFLSGISHFYKITKLISRNDTNGILKSMLYKYMRLLIFWVIFYAIQSTSVSKSALHLVYTPTEVKTSIWSILFLYDNFYGMRYMFFGPAHTFYTDVQLYFASCIILYLTRSYENKTKPIFFLAFGALVCRSLILYFHPDIYAFISYGMSVNQLCDWLSFMLATPFSRLPFYMSGIALGYYTRENSNSKITLSSCNRKIGWTVALICSSIALFCYYPMDSQYKYNSFDGAVISFINSFCWIIFLVWTTWYCEIIEKASHINRFLSSYTFVVLNRLTAYFGIFHIFVLYKCLSNTRLIFEFKLTEIIGLDYLFLSILASAFIMLFVHLPLKKTWDNFTTQRINMCEIGYDLSARQKRLNKRQKIGSLNDRE